MQESHFECFIVICIYDVSERGNFSLHYTHPLTYNAERLASMVFQVLVMTRTGVEPACNVLNPLFNLAGCMVAWCSGRGRRACCGAGRSRVRCQVFPRPCKLVLQPSCQVRSVRKCCGNHLDMRNYPGRLRPAGTCQ